MSNDNCPTCNNIAINCSCYSNPLERGKDFVSLRDASDLRRHNVQLRERIKELEVKNRKNEIRKASAKERDFYKDFIATVERNRKLEDKIKELENQLAQYKAGVTEKNDLICEQEDEIEELERRNRELASRVEELEFHLKTLTTDISSDDRSYNASPARAVLKRAGDKAKHPDDIRQTPLCEQDLKDGAKFLEEQDSVHPDGHDRLPCAGRQWGLGGK